MTNKDQWKTVGQGQPEAVGSGGSPGGVQRTWLGDRYKEGMCWDEHWVLYPTNESLNTITKTYDVICWLTEHNKKNHERLWSLGNKLRVSEGRGMRGMG